METNVSLRKLVHISGLLQELSFGEKLFEGDRPLVHNCKAAVVANLQNNLQKFELNILLTSYETNLHSNGTLNLLVRR